MCLTNLQTSMPHLPPDRSASPAPGGPATVPGQERAGKAEGAGEARARPLDGDQRAKPACPCPAPRAPGPVPRSCMRPWRGRGHGPGLEKPGVGQRREEGGTQGWVSQRGSLHSRHGWSQVKAGADQGRCPLRKHWGPPPRVGRGLLCAVLLRARLAARDPPRSQKSEIKYAEAARTVQTAEPGAGSVCRHPAGPRAPGQVPRGLPHGAWSPG